MQTSKGNVCVLRFAMVRAIDDLRAVEVREKIAASVSTGAAHCAHRAAAKTASDKRRFLTSAMYR